ncbi:MAG: hypothetical protein KC477_02475, partial [Oceanospirillaceae bacterium]|nr:hypothetical protein [Oceanospirillaceae bacterium]
MTTSQNLIVNGGFENDEVTLDRNWQVFGELDGWKALNNDIELQENGLYTNQSASEGDQWLELDYNGNAVEGVYQNIQTNAEQEYTLSLDVALRSGTQQSTNTIDIFWNGELVSRVEPGSSDWQNVTFTVEGTGGLDKLTLAHDAADADSFGGLIDNVALFEADGGDVDNGSKDNGSKDNGSKDKGSKDKGSKDKGSKDKGSKDKGSKDKGS